MVRGLIDLQGFPRVSNARTDEFLLRTQQINAIEIPTKRNQNSLHNFMNEGDSTIMASEKDWVTEREDLAALSHNAERGQVNAWLEEVLNHLCPRLLLVRRTSLTFCFLPLRYFREKGSPMACVETPDPIFWLIFKGSLLSMPSLFLNVSCSFSDVLATADTV